MTANRAFLMILALVGWTVSTHAGTLADVPLSLKGSVPPNVVFAISVEYPTANTAAYQGASDYSSTLEYLGLFDHAKCYDYDTANGWFAPASKATERTCSGSWSGNFLNWATMTGLDEFRFAMTGGNRYQDSASLTVLERTYQDGQGGTSNFPSKTFNGVGATPFDSEALTISNAGKGVGMTVTRGTTDRIDCTNPSRTAGAFSCSISLRSSSSAGSCTSWSGSGTAASPFRCAAFGVFANGESLPSVTPETSASASSTADTTVTCTNPTHNGTVFSCDLQDSSGNTGSCLEWSGTGLTADSPFKCVTFGTFSGSGQFAAQSSTTPTTFVRSVASQTRTDPGSVCSFAATPSVRINCSLTSGGVANCIDIIGDGSTVRYQCSTATPPNWTTTGAETGITHANPSTGGGGVTPTKYRLPSSITYTVPATSTTYYYVPSYSGSSTAPYYYYSTYLAGTAQTFQVRAKVCDATVGLEDNCREFGSSRKPTGVIQDFGDRMRFGAFSYYNSSDIDNAVMRSKLKYVAPEMFAVGQGTVANPAREWDNNGVLAANPDSSVAAASYGGAVANSGVINYVNKFGSTGTGTNRYKVYDNIGKLYYEALKYLRGKTPTTAFYEKSSLANNDNFPVITSWDDPQQYSCQKNYIITMGDMHTWCDKRLPGGQFTETLNATCNAKNGQADDKGSLSGDSDIDVGVWTNKIGDIEGISNPTLALKSAGVGNASYYMAGLAYWARINDIRLDVNDRPELDGPQTVKTFVIDVQEYKDTGVPGANKGSSQFWYATKYGGADRFDTSANPKPIDWFVKDRTVFGTTYTNSWPKTLLPAGDPKSMIASVKEAIESIVGEVGNESALAQASGDLRLGVGSFIYRSIFNSKDWSGDVQAFSIDTAANVSSSPVWTASAQLPTPANRRILTFNDGWAADGTAAASGSNLRQGVTFEFDNLSALQQSLLNADALGNVDSRGADRVLYIRGDESKEAPAPPTGSGYGWRDRTAKLGDFVNSSPAYVAAPLPFLSGPGYNIFAKAKKDRRPVIYVGGNDGMLHGFDASAAASGGVVPGKELLAFVPSAVYGNLNRLMDPGYAHKYYVDGSPVVSEACFSSCGGSSDWKTVLVGGLNAGGRGIYALNVSTPEEFATALPSDLVLWEFTGRDDPDLGYTFSKPLIRKLNNGRWAVIFGSGFNSTTSSANGAASSTGRAYLFILMIDGPGAGKPWVLNTDYFKIELKSPSEGANPTLPLTPPNGLASPAAIDVELDGVADFIYAGDRHGNLWKIDLTSSDPGDWGSAFGTAASPLPLFTATDASSKAQQITTGLEVSRHPNGGYIVLVGTGSFIDVTDPGSSDVQSYYGIWDKFDEAGTRVTRNKLQRQTVTATVGNAGDTFLIQSDCRPNYSTTELDTGTAPDCPSSLIVSKSDQQLGWVFDLPASGERSVSEGPLLEAGVLTFTSLSPSPNPCTGNTVGREYDLNYLTGGRVAGGVFDIDGNFKIDGNDLLGVSSLVSSSATVAPSGIVLKGGASERPVRFIVPPPPATTPPEVTPSTTCQPFIPGWGCPSQLGSRRTRAVEDKFSAGRLDASPTGGISGIKKVLSAQQGRITWRQIMQ